MCFTARGFCSSDLLSASKLVTALKWAGGSALADGTNA
jgi:hypothetical protein